MTYYPTLDEDLARAKEILEKGKPAAESLDGVIDEEGRITEAVITWGGATIEGGDVYAAYKLLESFVAAIGELQAAVKGAETLVGVNLQTITDLQRWKDAIEDACITDWIFTKAHETNPRLAVNDLLAHQTKVQQEALTAMTGRNVQLLVEVDQVRAEIAGLRGQNEEFLSMIRELRLALEGQHG